jgi:malonyl-CoA O-methyltransferase
MKTLPTIGLVSRWLHRAAPREMLAASAAYELWSEVYPPRAHNPLMELEQAVMEGIVSRLTAASALDVGTGSGRYLPVLAATGARVVGVDRSWAMLTRDPSPFPRTCADAYRLPFRAACFDLVTSSLMAGDIADLETCVGELARVLAPGGHLVYSDFHPSWVEHGWRRTFDTADGRRFAVPHHPHAIDDHLRALEAARLEVAAIREPRLTGSASSPRGRRRSSDPPLVVILHARKPRGWRAC